MFDSQVSLSVEERDYLLDLLNAALKDARVEEHRTRSPIYRESVLHREEVIASMLKKLEKVRV